MRYAVAVVAGALCCAPATAAAQQIAPAVSIPPGNTVLNVSAEGKSVRMPDVAVFNAGVVTQGKSATEALSANSVAMSRVITRLQTAGIADRDIQTSNLNVEPVYSDPNREAVMAARASGQPYIPSAPDASVPKIVGYRASNSVAVRQRDLKSFGRVIDTLVSAGANQVNGPAFTMDDAEPALDEARAQAVKKARERAQLYARAAGLRVVRILSITEGGGYYGPSPVVVVTGQSIGGAPPPPPPPPAPVQPGELQIGANVNVLFELSP